MASIVVKCPYYRKHTKLTIVCDSLKHPDHERIVHREKPSDVKAHIRAYCSSVTDWEGCQHARKLTEIHLKRKGEGKEMWKQENESDGYELGRYKRKVAQMLEQEKELKEQIALKDIMLENALLYMMYLATLNAEIPCEYVIDYKELRKLSNKYRVEYTPISDRGMKLCIKGRNTETEKQ